MQKAERGFKTFNYKSDRNTMPVPIPGKRRRGRQKTKSRVRDMESVGLKEEDALDRTKWKNDISIPFRRPQLMGKARGEK